MAVTAEELKTRIAALPKHGDKRQYTAAVKRDVIDYVCTRIAAGVSEAAACNELELHQATVSGWRKGSKMDASKNGSPRVRVRPVELAPSETKRRFVVILPGGARVEGLDLCDLVELARALA